MSEFTVRQALRQFSGTCDQKFFSGTASAPEFNMYRNTCWVEKYLYFYFLISQKIINNILFLKSIYIHSIRFNTIKCY